MISSPQNRRLKDIRRLRRSKGDRALLEGPHLLREALAAERTLELVLATPEWAASDQGEQLLGQVAAEVALVHSPLLEALTDADSPRGVLAVAVLPRPTVEGLPLAPGACYLYLDGVQDPGNLGALTRVAEAAGCAGVACGPGCAHPNHPRSLRASAGSLLRLPVTRAAGVAALDRRVAPLEPTWLALEARRGEPLWRAPLSGTLVLLLGAEGEGLSSPARARADRAVQIPMAPAVESLNVATAAAVVLFERQRRAVRG